MGLILLVSGCTIPDTTRNPGTEPAASSTTMTRTPTETTAVRRTTTTKPATTIPTTTTDTSVDDEYGSVASMTLEDKAAQLLMVEFSGSTASVGVNLLDEYPLGGFLLKSANGNFVSTDQVRDLISQLQAVSSTPLLLAVDQEGGRIDRIKFDDLRRFPSPEVFGTLNDPSLTERAAWATGTQLAALGINVDFAPVADVNVLGDENPAIGDRSYGSDPNLVARMAVAAVHGFESSGVAAAVKHFPGHGNTTVDSHLGLPVVRTERDQWAATDRVPFEAAINAGVPMVMVAHVAYPALDAEGLPASMSYAITTEQLRQALGFGGVVVTDDLANMAAVGAWGPGERAVRALMAGADLLLNPGDVKEAVEAIVLAVDGGRIDERVVDAAVARLLKLKANLGLYERVGPVPLDSATLDAVQAVANDIGEACAAAEFDC